MLWMIKSITKYNEHEHAGARKFFFLNEIAFILLKNKFFYWIFARKNIFLGKRYSIFKTRLMNRGVTVMGSFDYFLLKKYLRDFRHARKRLSSFPNLEYEAGELYRDVLAQKDHELTQNTVTAILSQYTDSREDLTLLFQRSSIFVLEEQLRSGREPHDIFQDKILWSSVFYWLGRHCWGKHNDISLIFLERAVILIHECIGSMGYVNQMVRIVSEREQRTTAAIKGGSVKSDLHTKIRSEAIRILNEKVLLGFSWKSKKEAADAIAGELWGCVQQIDPKNSMNFSETEFSYSITRWNQPDIKRAFSHAVKKENSKRRKKSKKTNKK